MQNRWKINAKSMKNRCRINANRRKIGAKSMQNWLKIGSKSAQNQRWIGEKRRKNGAKSALNRPKTAQNLKIAPKLIKKVVNDLIVILFTCKNVRPLFFFGHPVILKIVDFFAISFLRLSVKCMKFANENKNFSVTKSVIV